MNVAEARAVRYTNVSAKKHVIGSKAVNPQNEALGRLEDLMLRAGVGRARTGLCSELNRFASPSMTS